MSGNIRHQPLQTIRSTGNGALALTIAPQQDFLLLEARIHLSSASATEEDLTIAQNALGDGTVSAAYDTVFLAQDMNTVADFVFVPDIPDAFVKGDELDFAWTNTDARTFGLEVKIQLI